MPPAIPTVAPVSLPANIIGLLAEWKKDAPPGPDAYFPDIKDQPADPENIF